MIIEKRQLWEALSGVEPPSNDAVDAGSVVTKFESIVEALERYTSAAYRGAAKYSVGAIAGEILQLGWPQHEAGQIHRMRCHLHAARMCLSDNVLRFKAIASTGGPDVIDRMNSCYQTLYETSVDLQSFLFPEHVMRRCFPYALESHRLAGLHYRRVNDTHKYIGSMSSMSASCFLLRQALELRIFEAFGIQSVTFPDGRPARPSRGSSYKQPLLDIVKKGGLPIPMSLVKTVDKWCNLSVHSGWRCYSWEFFIAEAAVRPLFEWAQYGEEQSLTGSIKLSRAMIDEGQAAVTKIIPKGASLNRRDPQCFIVLDHEVPPPIP